MQVSSKEESIDFRHAGAGFSDFVQQHDFHGIALVGRVDLARQPKKQLVVATPAKLVSVGGF